MTRLATALVLITLSAGLLAGTQTPASPEVLLKAAMQKEQVDGDVPGALAQYKAIVDQFPKDPAAPKALLRMARIYERQTDRPAAQASYRRLVADYPDSAEADEARNRVAASAGAQAKETRLTPTGRAADGMLYSGRVSPDGRYVSFADTFSAELGGTGNLAVWDTRLDRVTVLNKFSNATPWGDGFAEDSAWSPDGWSLAYAWYVQGEDNHREIRIVDRKDGRHRVVFTSAEGVIRVTPFAFSPDGRSLLASLAVPAGEGTIRSAELALIAVADGRKQTLKTFDGSAPGGGVFSADGQFVAFDFQSRSGSPSRDISVVALADRREIPVTNDPTVDDTLLGWFADGHLLFSSDRNGTVDAFAVPVTNGAVQSAPVVVKRDVGRLASRGITRDGSVFVEKLIAVREIFVAELDPVTGKAIRPPAPLQRVHPTVARSEPAWSPDGTRIAYVQSAPGVPQSVVVQTMGTGDIRVYPVKVRNIDWPLWRPDGQAFIFDGTGEDNVQRTFSLDVASGRVSPMSDKIILGFSHEGRFVYETDQGQGVGEGVWRRSLTDGKTLRVGEPGQRGTAVSPDGQWTAFLTRGGGIGNATLSIRSTEGGEAKALVRGFRAGYARIAWSVDSRYVIFNINGSGLNRVSIDGGSPEPLDVKVPGVIREKAMNPDGRRLAFSIARSGRELWVWENVVPKEKQP